MKVTAAIFRKNDNVLLMRRASGQVLAEEWECPGVKFEASETDQKCLPRELIKELNIEASIKDLQYYSHNQHGQKSNFLPMRLLIIKEQCLNGHDVIEWVPLKKLVST